MFFAKIAQLVAQGNGQDAGEDENEGLFQPNLQMKKIMTAR